MTQEEAKERMMEYNGKCNYCEQYPDCEKHACPTDEEIIQKIMEVEK